ncbi:MAG: InlB B-repeat-containing protein, partial [Phocaeicola sp.]
TPVDGYVLEGWYEGEKKLETKDDITISENTIKVKLSEATGGKKYEAKFKVDIYSVTFSALAGGEINPSGKQSAEFGTIITSTAKASSMYMFLGWFEKGSVNPITSTSGDVFVSNDGKTLNVNSLLSVNNKEYIAKFGLGAPRLYVSGTGEDAMLTITYNPAEPGTFFQFGSIIAWDNGVDLLQTFNPTQSVGPLWNNGWSSDANHSLENLKEGKGDPCALVGFTIAEVKQMLGEGRIPNNNKWRTPKNDENITYASNYSNWTTFNGIKGRYFGLGATPTSLGGEFLPVSGFRSATDGRLLNAASHGFYWSITDSYDMSFADNFVYSSRQHSKANAFSVRCISI